MKYKISFLIIAVALILSSCVENDDYSKCRNRVDPVIYERVFNTCLDKASSARKSNSYTTSEDEDYDEVISECRRSARWIAEAFFENQCRSKTDDK